MAGKGDSPEAAAQPLDRGSPMPLWAQLRDDLRRRLAAGAFRKAFPGELTLVADYEVSRQTVRAALRELRADGIVVAERGRRPRLAAPTTITQPLGALYSLFASVEAAGLRQTSVIRARDVRADGVIADRLGLEASTPLFYLQRLRLAGDEPLALDTVWLPAHIAAPLLDADFTHTALYGELADRTGIRLHGGHEHIRAVVLTRAEQRILQITPATGALAIDRLGHADGEPIEWRHTIIRGDRFSLLADFSPRTGYQLNLSSLYPTAAAGSLLARSRSRAPSPAAVRSTTSGAMRMT